MTTTYEFLRWEDIGLRDMTRPMWIRLQRSIVVPTLAGGIVAWLAEKHARLTPPAAESSRQWPLEIDPDFARDSRALTVLALGTSLPVAAFHPRSTAVREAIRRVAVFRMHFQFIMANDRRGPYDDFMMTCGPAPILDWVTNGLEVVARFSENAAYDRRLE